MHIPDNYLSPQTDAVMAVAMVPVWVHCIKKENAAQMPRKAMCSRSSVARTFLIQ